MVFTDPPYELITKGGGLLKESKAMREISELGIDKFNPESLSLHAETNIFCCNKPLIKKYIELAETHKVSWDLAIYHKQNITANYGGHLMTDIEYLLVIGKQAPRTGLGEDKSLYSKLYSGGKDQDNVTAWSKPVALCEKFIKLYSTKSVMDYFGGSGSTLIACEKTKRKCFMMELDPHYIDVIVSRWCKYTGKTKIKRNGEEMDWITQ
jgi:16S rRNA G966 N2-methylase RsmD